MAKKNTVKMKEAWRVEIDPYAGESDMFRFKIVGVNTNGTDVEISGKMYDHQLSHLAKGISDVVKHRVQRVNSLKNSVNKSFDTE